MQYLPLKLWVIGTDNLQRCGHCQNLKPAYEKAAKSLSGLAKVAAVNCDEEVNKPFCGQMGVKGFPTLKIVKPGKKAGKPFVDDYQGARTAKGIVDAVIDKIPNHVKRLKDDDYEAWLEDGDGPKAILFSEKATTSALLKAVAVEFLGAINIAQIRSKENEAVEVFNVDKFPALVLVPGGGKDPQTYSGEMKKDAMVKFLTQAADPNPDPAPKKSKSKPSSSKADKKASSSFSKASASHASSEAKTDKAFQTAETVENDPTESPDPNVVSEDTPKPVKVPVAPPLPSLGEGLTLQQNCLNTKAGTCLLALIPNESAGSEESAKVIASLSEIHHKYAVGKHALFPFFQLPAANEQNAQLRTALKLGQGLELVALNGKRGWYRHYPHPTFSKAEIEDWVDAIRMGEGAKEKVPAGVIVDAGSLPEEKIEVKLDDDRIITDFRGQVPEGLDLQMEEVSDEDLEKILADASARAKENKAKESGKAEAEVEVEEDVHDEL